MKKGKVLLLMGFILSASISFGQFKIKTPDLEKKAKEKIEKAKKNKKGEVEDKVDEEKTTNTKDVKAGKTPDAIVDKSKYTENFASVVTVPTLEIYSDMEYKNKVDEVIPGESDFYGKIIFPKNIKDYMIENEIVPDEVNRVGAGYEIDMILFDSDGEKREINKVLSPNSEWDFEGAEKIREVRFMIHGTDKSVENFDKIRITGDRTIYLPDSEDAMRINMSTTLVKYIFGEKSGNGDFNKKLPIGKQNITLKLLNSYPTGKEIATFQMPYNVKQENMAKLIPYHPYPHHFEKIEDNGVNTELHKNNLNKIVFSNEEIKVGLNDPSKLKSEFKLTDMIYGRVFLPESPANMIRTKNMFADPKYIINGRYRIYLDGVEQKHIHLPSDFNAKETSNGFKVAHQPAEDDYRLVAASLAYVLSKVSAGTHTIKMEYLPIVRDWEAYIGDKNPDVFATGEFKVSFTVAERDAFVKKHGLHYKTGYDLATDQSFVSLSKKAHASQRSSGYYKVTVREPEVHRNHYGNVTHRTSTLYVVETNKDGNHEYVYYALRQEFIGGKWAAKVSANRGEPDLCFIAEQNFK